MNEHDSITGQTGGLGRLRLALASVAFAGIMGILLITLGDIILRLIDWAGLSRRIGLPRSVPGVLDLVEYAQVVAAQFAIACGFAAGVHISVDVLTTHFSRRVMFAVDVAIAAICVLFLTLCVQQAGAQLAFQYAAPQVSATLGWPLWWYWVPTLAGLALSLVACCARAVLEWRAVRKDG